MSDSRQPGPRVRSYSITHPPGRVALPTQPGWDQVVFADAGHFTARTSTLAWTVPVHRALCVPDGTRVRIETTRRCAMRCLYLDVALGVLAPGVRVIGLAGLTRGLLDHAVDRAPMDLADPADAALVTLLADRVTHSPDAPLQLPLPVDDAARAVAAAVMADPSADIAAVVAGVGAGRRTVERRFRAETAMSLGQWRRRARILAAVAMLADGASVTRVAGAVGYATPSSFVAAFRSELHAPPGEFLRTRGRTAAPAGG